MPGGQAHGLVAHRSVGNEDRGLGGIFAAPRQQLRAISLDRGALAAIGRRTMEPRRYRAYPACDRRAPQLG
jgi:hypothetical protein